MPNWLMVIANRSDLSTVEKLLLCLMADCASRQVELTHFELAALCSSSRRSVFTALKNLRRHDLIIQNWRGGQKSNIYIAGWRLKQVLTPKRKKGEQSCTTTKLKS